MSSRVNLLAPKVRMNPYPLYAESRQNAPVSQVDPGGLWAVARYADVVTVMKNPQLFSSEGIRRTYRPDSDSPTTRWPTPCSSWIHRTTPGCARSSAGRSGPRW